MVMVMLMATRTRQALCKVPVSSGSSSSAVSPERQGVVSLPGLPPSGSGLGECVTLAQATGLLAGGGEASGFAVLVIRVSKSKTGKNRKNAKVRPSTL